MNLADAKTRAWLEGYYRPLVGMTLVAPLETVPGHGAGALLVRDGAGQEFELEVSCDPEGNGPGFLFFATDDEDEEIDVEELRIIDFQLTQGEWDDEWTYWPTLFLARPGKSPLKVEVSMDPEGNGPGHLLGVPQAAERVGAIPEAGPRLRDSSLAGRR